MSYESCGTSKLNAEKRCTRDTEADLMTKPYTDSYNVLLPIDTLSYYAMTHDDFLRTKFRDMTSGSFQFKIINGFLSVWTLRF